MRNRLWLALLCITAMMLFCDDTGAKVHLWVSPDGDDTNSGTLESPFATMEKARDTLRAMRNTNPELLAEGALVEIDGRALEMRQPFTLEAQDSGTAEGRIYYYGMAETGAGILGGKVMQPEDFGKVVDADILMKLDSRARDNILFADLNALGIGELGKFPDVYSTPPAISELFFNNKRMTLARWPNGNEWATISKIVDSGPAPWRNHQSDGTGTFEYSGDRPDRWVTAPAVWLYGYWCFDWASETIRVHSIDTDKKCITLKTPHVYGIGSGNKAERRYCALNLLEELDAPGEYYIDRENGRIYFWPPGPLKKDSMVLSLLQEPVIQLNNVSHVTLHGLKISCCAGNAIQVEGGEAVHVENCRVDNAGLNGIVVKEGMRHHIDRCFVCKTGTGGVVVEGGDRKTLKACGHEITNNEITDIGIRQRTHAYNVHISGVGIRLAHNEIRNAPHQAIGLGGNDHIIEYNKIINVCQESDDCGAFYMGRNPSERGNIIRYNYWQDTGGPLSHGSCAIYLDDGTCGQEIYGNIFVRAAGGNFGAVFVHGGHDNRVYNNVFIDCKAAMRHVRWDDNRWKEWVNGDFWKERLLNEVDITKPPYSNRYPALKGFFEFNGELRTNYSAGNVVVRCPMLSDGDWKQENNFVTDDDSFFLDAEGMNYQIRSDSIVFKEIPHFDPINCGEMGRQ